MIRLITAFLVLALAGACTSKSSSGTPEPSPTGGQPAGGNTGDTGGNPDNGAKAIPGFCVINVPELDGRICTQYSGPGLTTQNVQGGCQQSGGTYVVTCPFADPILICKIADQSGNMEIHSLQAAPEQKDAGVQLCQANGGTVL